MIRVFGYNKYFLLLQIFCKLCHTWPCELDSHLAHMCFAVCLCVFMFKFNYMQGARALLSSQLPSLWVCDVSTNKQCHKEIRAEVAAVWAALNKSACSWWRALSLLLVYGLKSCPDVLLYIVVGMVWYMATPLKNEMYCSANCLI